MHMTAKTFNLGEAKFTPLQVPSQLYVHEPDTLHGTPWNRDGYEVPCIPAARYISARRSVG